MIKIAGTLLLLLSITITKAAKPSGYSIQGTFRGLVNGTVLELIPAGTHDEEKAVASTVITAGKFSFKGSLNEPRLFMITVKGHYGGCQVMVCNTNISITAKASVDERNAAKFLALTDLKITGSPVHQEYLQKVAYREMLNKEHTAYYKRGEAILSEIRAAKKEKDTAKLTLLMKTPAYRLFEADEKAFFDKVAKTSTETIEANKETWWGPFLMLNAYSYFTKDQGPQFELFSKAAQESYYGQKIKEELFPKGFMNQKAPLVEAATVEKKDAELQKLVKDYKYTLVDFWASWCAPCRKSIPALKELYKEMNGKGLQIVSISIDKKEADWLKAEQEEQLKWPSFLDKGTTAAAWKVRAIPAMFLLDQNGTVVAENLSIEEVRAKFN